jgi:hypothetical protein
MAYTKLVPQPVEVAQLGLRYDLPSSLSVSVSVSVYSLVPYPSPARRQDEAIAGELRGYAFSVRQSRRSPVGVVSDWH